MKKETLQQIADREGVSRQAVWLRSAKGKAYRKTDKCKAYQKAYQKTDKGKACRKAYQKAYHQTAKYKTYIRSDKYKAYKKVYLKAYQKRIYVPVSKLRELGLIK